MTMRESKVHHISISRYNPIYLLMATLPSTSSIMNTVRDHYIAQFNYYQLY